MVSTGVPLETPKEFTSAKVSIYALVAKNEQYQRHATPNIFVALDFQPLHAAAHLLASKCNAHRQQVSFDCSRLCSKIPMFYPGLQSSSI